MSLEGGGEKQKQKGLVVGYVVLVLVHSQQSGVWVLVEHPNTWLRVYDLVCVLEKTGSTWSRVRASSTCNLLIQQENVHVIWFTTALGCEQCP
jgi:hypothetical protein